MDAKEIITLSRFNEFPDVLVTLELCRAMAQIEKRRVGESLRACARALLLRAEHELLRATLEEMTKSAFPETQMLRIRDCIRRMETALDRKVVRQPVGAIYPDLIQKEAKIAH